MSERGLAAMIAAAEMASGDHHLPDRSRDWVMDGVRAKVPSGSGVKDAFGGFYGDLGRYPRFIFNRADKPAGNYVQQAYRDDFMRDMRDAKNEMVKASPRIQAALQHLRDQQLKRGLGPAPFGPQTGGY